MANRVEHANGMTTAEYTETLNLKKMQDPGCCRGVAIIMVAISHIHYLLGTCLFWDQCPIQRFCGRDHYKHHVNRVRTLTMSGIQPHLDPKP